MFVRARRAGTAGLLAFACAGAADPAPAERPAQDAPECILIQSIDTWKALGADRLVVWVLPGRRAYEVELVARCPGLLFADAIGITSIGRRTCDASGEAVIVDGVPCPIRAIHPYAPDGAGGD